MTNALVVIDVQESFRARPLWQEIDNPEVAKRAQRLVDHARAAGDLVIWVLHSEPGSGDVFDPALGHVRLIEPLSPVAGEPVLTKTAHNAFTTTNLQQLLVQHGVTALTVCGIRTEQCVETTARLASDLGYEVTFVVDATAMNPIPLPDGSRTLSAEEVVARTVAVLSGRFATVRTVEDVVG